MRHKLTGFDANVEGERHALYALLGDLPDRFTPIRAESLGVEPGEHYTLERLVLHLNGVEAVPAYFAKPLGAHGRLPLVLYQHAHGGNYALGKEELLVGRPALQRPPYVQALTEHGYAVLAIDHWLFGERSGRTESETFKAMLWQGQVLWGMIMYDALRTVDYAMGRDDVDPARIATVGMSFGSTISWWLAALDERIKACVDICCLTDYQALLDQRGLDGHGIYYYVPGLLKHFSAGQINALIAPRAHLSLVGMYDKLTPPEGVDRIDAHVSARYAALEAAGAWKLCRYPCGHQETAAMRHETVTFLARFL